MIEVLSMLVGQEVFVVASDEVSHMHSSDEHRIFRVFDNMDDLIEGIKDLEVSKAENLRVIHGVLSTAEVLPSDLKERTAFVLALDCSSDDGYMVEAGDTVDHVEESVKDIVSEGIGDCYDVDIGHVFVVYGYELSFTLSVNADDFDDEIIDSCRRIVEETEEIYERNRSQL